MQHDGIFQYRQVNTVESVQDLIKNASVEREILRNESLPPSIDWFATLKIFSPTILYQIKKYKTSIKDLRSIVGKIGVTPRLDIAQPGLHDDAERLVVWPILDAA